MKRAHVVADPSAFERFENLARRLFAVPKKELDRKLAQHEKRKVRRLGSERYPPA